MRKSKVTILVLFVLTLFFVGETLSAYDVYGQGSAAWGDSKSKIRGRFSKKLRMGAVRIVKDTTNWLWVDYIGERIRQKKYEFYRGRLVRIYIYYNNPERRIVNTYTGKYGSFTIIGNERVWSFPSTIITHKIKSQRVVFRDRAYNPQKSNGNGGSSVSGIGQVKIGMTPDQVRRIMGKPSSIATGLKGYLVYRYPSGSVTFRFGKVTRVERNASAGPRKVRRRW